MYVAVTQGRKVRPTGGEGFSRVPEGSSSAQCRESLRVCLEALSAKVAVEALKGTYGTGSWDVINLTEWADGHLGGLLTS